MSLRFSLPSAVHSHAVLAFSVALAVTTILVASPALAQTAHVSYTQSTVASGFGNAAAVAVDGSGNVYVVDNGTVLKETLSAGGTYTQSTVASSTVDVFKGVAVDGSGDVYITYLQGSNGGVLKETPSESGYTESTIVSGLLSPAGVAVDGSGNVYVVDSGASLVLKEMATGSGYTQSTVASGLNAPAGVAVDWSGNVYITVAGATNGGGVLKETLSGSTYTESTIGNAPSRLSGLAVDDNGNVYIANSTANLVLKETPSGTGYTQSTAISGLNGPAGVAVAAGGNVYIANSGGGNVLNESLLADFGLLPVGSSSSTVLVSFTFDTAGTPGGWNVYTQGAKGLDFTEVAASTTCSTSTGSAAGDTCSVAVRFSPKYAGLRMGAVQLLDAGGNTIATALLRGIGSAPQVVFPGNQTVRRVGSGIAKSYAVAVDGSGDVFVVNGSTVEEIVATNGQVSSGSTVNTVGTGFNRPQGVAVDALGDVFVAEAGTGTVKEIVAVDGAVSTNSTVRTVVGGFVNPLGMAVDGSGDVFVADGDNGVVGALYEIVAIDGAVSSNSTVKTVGGGFVAPSGVALDGSGNVYVNDHDAVMEMPAACTSSSCVKTLVSGLTIFGPLAVDAGGNVYLADPLGIVYELPAGCASPSCVKTLVSISYYPNGVALNGNGDLFLAEAYASGGVHEISLATPPSLSFPTATPKGTTDTADGPRSFTIANSGNAPLTFPVPSTGSNPSVSANFAWDNSSTCVQTDASSSTAFTLAPGASCTVAIDFTPVSAGTIAGSVVLTDNALNAIPSATQTISLSGTAPATPNTIIAVSNTVVSYNPGNDQVVTLTATLTSTAGTVNAGTVTFTVLQGNSPVGSPVTASVSNGQAVVNFSLPGGTAPGVYTVEAAYSGSGKFTPGSDSTHTLTVTAAATSTVAAGASAVFSASAQNVTLTAAVTSAVGTVNIGTVTFTVLQGNSPVGSPATANVSNGQAVAAWVLPAGTPAGVYTIQPDYSAGTATLAASSDSTHRLTVVLPGAPPPLLLVNSTADDASGTPGNCPAGGGTAACTLRDALAAASNAGAGNITFSSTVFTASNTAAENTITLTAGGTLNIPSNTTITGLTTGSGATLTNLVTVSGGGAGVFNVNSWVTGVTIANLTVASGSTGNAGTLAVKDSTFSGILGSAIGNTGTLTVSGSTFSGIWGSAITNSGALTVSGGTFAGNFNDVLCKLCNGGVQAQAYGAAIYSVGELTVSNSTFSGNSVSAKCEWCNDGTSQSDGGAIYGAGTVIVSDSTFSGNAVDCFPCGAGHGGGGAIFLQSGTLTVTNSLFTGNSALAVSGGAIWAGGTVVVSDSVLTGDSGGECIGSGCPTNGSNGNVVGTAPANLSALGNHGGPTQTLVPLPGDPAICLFTPSSATGTDQRGFPRTTTYGTTSCQDAGAVQTNYALNFTTPPAATENSGFAFPVAVTLTESGLGFGGVSIPITLSGGGTLAGSPVSSTTGSNGVASYSLTVRSATPLSGLTLTAAPQSPPPVTATAGFDLAAATPTSLTATVTPGSTLTYGQQPAVSVALGPPTVPAVPATDFTATLDSSTALTITAEGGNVFNIGLPATPLTAGPHSIVANFLGSTGYQPSSTTISLTVIGPSLVVNTASDDGSANASNCTSTPEGTCTLRDALAAAATTGGANITFSPTVFTQSNTAAQNTITVTLPMLKIPANTTITGLTTGSGATVTNLVTVDGGGNTNWLGSVFTVGSGDTGTAIANLNIVNASSIFGGAIWNGGTLMVSDSTFSGNAAVVGGAIWNGGTLMVNDSTFSANTGDNGNIVVVSTGMMISAYGGAIDNSGTLTVSGSTFSGNSVSSSIINGWIGPSGGGAIRNTGTLTVSSSTFSGNSASGLPPSDGGAIYQQSGTLTVSNSTFSGNSVLVSADPNVGYGGAIYYLGGTLAVSGSLLTGDTGGECFSDNGSGCPTNGSNGNVLDAGSAALSPLGNYGGPTQTFVPLPGSPAICAISPSSATGTDQRGFPRTTTYGSTTCQDAGAVETNYSLSFSTEPPSTVKEGADFSAAVTLAESGSPFSGGSVVIPLTLNATSGTLSGGSAATTNGVATYPSLQVSAAGVDDTLTANLLLTASSAAVQESLAQTSSSFNVDSLLQAPTTIAVSNATATFSTSAQSVTLTATVSSPSGTVNGGTVTFKVLRGATPVGSAVTSSAVTAGAASVAYTVPGGAAAGTYTILAVYNGTTNFGGSSDNTHTQTINKATPVIAWTPAATIGVGTSLAGLMVATASYNNSSLPGTFSYTAQTAGSAAVSVTASTVLGRGTYTLTAAFAATDSNDYQNVSATASLTVSPATLTITADNAGKTYGTANPAFTGKVTGGRNGDTFKESFSTTATVSSPVGTYPIVPSVEGADLADYDQSITEGTLTITQAATTTMLEAGSTSITPGQSVTLTATVVSATTGTPTGTVSFYDNGTQLNTTPATLNAGVATYPTTSLAPGVTHTLTATYSGDINFAGSSSATTVSVAVAALDFTMTMAGPGSATLAPGGSVTYQVKVSPDYGSYAGTVSFTVAGLPPGASATFSPSSIAANGGPQTITVTISAPATTQVSHPPSAGSRLAPMALAIFLLPFALSLRRCGRSLSRFALLCTLVLSGIAVTAWLSGCGSSNAHFAQPPKSYTVTITATAGNITHTTKLTVDVE